MSDFSIRTKETEVASGKLDKIYINFLNKADRVETIKNNLSDTSAMAGVRNSLDRVCGNINNQADTVKIFAERITEIARLYQITEDRIMGRPEKGKTNMSPQASADVQPEENKSWWDEFKELFDQDQNNDEWYQRFLRDMIMNMIVPGSSSFTYIWEHIDDDTYMGKTLRQVIYGNFTEDSTGLGIALSIVVGCIPIVGQLADIRDLVGDIYNLTQNGATAEEWVSFGLSVVAFIPIAGDALKHADEVGEALQGVRKYLPDFVEGLQKTLKNIDDMAESVDNFKIFKKWNEMKDTFDKNVVDKVKDGVDDFMDNIPGIGKIKGIIDDALPQGKDVVEIGRDLFGGWLEKICNDKIKETIVGYFEDKAQSLQAAA